MEQFTPEAEHPSTAGRKYPFNERVMDTWTKESAYFLGWTITDGYINRYGVQFCMADWEACEILRRIAEHPTPPWLRHGNTGHWRVSFNSTYLATRMRELGVFSPKSLTMRLPPVPEEVFSHFIRGVVDGNGSVQAIRTHLSITINTCSPDFSDDLMRALPGRPHRHVYSKNRLPIHKVFYTCSSALEFGAWLYQDSEGLRLSRKFATFQTAPPLEARPRRFYTLNGETLQLSEWVRRFNVPYERTRERLERGWPLEKALASGTFHRYGKHTPAP
jgi:hypothetical protein